MTASEAALGLAAAHRPQVSGMLLLRRIVTKTYSAQVDAVHISADVAKPAVIPPAPDVPIESSTVDTNLAELNPEPVPSTELKEVAEDSVSSSVEGHTRPPSPPPDTP